MAKRLFSFDVFDTAVSRPYCRPVDLFAQVYESLVRQHGNFASPETFVLARREAERRARRKCLGRDDIRLDDIYDSFPELSEWGLDHEQVKWIEVEHEIDLAVPVGEILAQATSLQEESERVVFVSDMYLPVPVILSILRKCGYRVDTKDVYVSGEVGYSKYSGRLFDFVAEKEGVVPGNCFHTGDNYRADVVSARGRGWNSVHYKGCEFSRYEKAERGNWDFSASLYKGVSRAARVRCVSGNASASRLVADIVGPFLTSFVRFVLLDAERDGLSTLYFVSRDGQILFRIAESLQKAGVAQGVSCRYMYGSRQAFLLASVVDREPASIEWAFTKGTSSSPRDILHRLGLTDDEAAQSLPQLNLGAEDLNSSLSDGQVEQLASDLVRSPVMELILSRAQERRSALMCYLSDIGFLSPKSRVALVDVGWALNMQRSLARSLRAEGYMEPPSGYYLGAVAPDAEDELGSVRAFVGLPSTKIQSVFKAKWLFRLSSIIVIEHLFMMADHPGVIGFQESTDGKVEAVFRADQRDARTKKFALDLHAEAIAYASLAEKIIGEKLSSREFMDWGVECARKFLMQPAYEDVMPFSWVNTNKELSHEKKFDSVLASPLTALDVFRMVIYDLSGTRESFHSRGYSWIPGAVAISSVYVRFLCKLLVANKKLLHLISRAWR